MDPKRLQKDCMEGWRPLGVGENRNENKLTAWRIDRGITKTKLPTLFSVFQETFRPLKPTGETWWS